VCLGTGTSNTVAETGVCRSCGGSTVCSYCADVTVDLTEHAVVPEQRQNEEIGSPASTMR
jgi:hypothetical protein